MSIDESRFDHLTRAIGRASSRRAGLKAALGGLLALGLAPLPAGEAGAKKKRKKKRSRMECSAEKPCPVGMFCFVHPELGSQCFCASNGLPPCGESCCTVSQTCDQTDGKPRCLCPSGHAACNGACCEDGQICVDGACAPGPVCPSGQQLRDGICTCTRDLCGGACCAGNQTCQNGACVTTGLRDCGNVAIVDGADLSHCRLQNRTIGLRALRNANFAGADLTGARFTGQFQPWGCSFAGATLRKATLEECDLKPGTTFAGADMTDADLRSSHIDDVDFSGADLSGALLYPNRVARSTFTGASLRGALLYGSTFSGCDFSRADLTDVALGRMNSLSTTFDDCAMAGMTFRPSGAIGQRGAAFTRVSMRGATLWTRGVDMHAISWFSVDLTGATGEPPGPSRFSRWCWNVLADGSRSSATWGGGTCPCAAGPDACWPHA